MNYAELLDYSDNQFCHIAELNKTNKKLEIRIAELEKELTKTKQSQESGWLRDSNTHVNKSKEQGE